MSKMSQLAFEIQEMVEDNYPPLAIAAALDVPSEWVHEVKDDLEREYEDEGLIDEY